MILRAVVIATLSVWTRAAFAQGAVPIPDETAPLTCQIQCGPNSRDTSVTVAELPPLSSAWKRRMRVPYEGEVPVALNGHDLGLYLTFIGPVDPETSYPTKLKELQIFAKSEGSEGYTNSFAPLALDYKRSADRGPIHAAVRVRPTDKSPESQRRQVVVYNPAGKPNIVLVATKLVTAKKWIPFARIDLPVGAQINLMDPGWH